MLDKRDIPALKSDTGAFRQSIYRYLAAAEFHRDKIGILVIDDDETICALFKTHWRMPVTNHYRQ